jgi:hypothetical protein
MKSPPSATALGVFWGQCPHRSACARRDLYTPKDSSKSELLQAISNLQGMLVGIPLTDDERAAVEDGQAALEQLLQGLAEIPTPAGATPRELATPVARGCRSSSIPAAESDPGA